MKIVEVKLKLDKVYSGSPCYCKSFYPIGVGEMVVVELADKGLQVAMVSAQVEGDFKDIEGYVVQRINLAEYSRLRKNEEELDRKREAIRKLLMAADDHMLSTMITYYQEELDKRNNNKA